jgi:hypothetical protein
MVTLTVLAVSNPALEQMYDKPMELHEGHIHQAANSSGAVAVIWPTPDPGLWHISAPPKRATVAPVPTDEVEAVLERWDFHAAGPWAHWAGDPREVNPQPEIWAAYDTIGRER